MLTCDAATCLNIACDSVQSFKKETKNDICAQY